MQHKPQNLRPRNSDRSSREKDAIRIFEEYLRRQRLKMTRERREIVQAVFSRKDHFSIEELIEEFRSKGRKASRATLYRTLDLMVRCKLVERHTFRDGRNYFETSLGVPNHDHLMCVDCERVIEYANAEILELARRVCRDNNMELVDHVHKIYASCMVSDCKYRPADE